MLPEDDFIIPGQVDMMGRIETIDDSFRKFAKVFLNIQQQTDLNAVVDKCVELSTEQIEANTWTLIKMLTSHRFIPPDQPMLKFNFASDHALIGHINETSDVGEYMQVKEWLEQTAPEFNPVEVRQGFNLATTRQHRNMLDKQKSLVSQIDPDAELREKASLALDDSTFQQALNRSIFEYIRRGDFLSACDLCQSCDQPWRSALIIGMMPSSDPLLDINEEEILPYGNANKQVWRSICLKIASQSTDLYERALFSHLAGDPTGTIPVCSTWEDQLWTMYNSLIESTLAEKLAAINQLQQSPYKAEVVTSLPPPPTRTASPSEIINFVTEKSKNIHAHHSIQSYIILNQIPTMLSTLAFQLSSLAHRRNISNLPQILRFVVHFIIFLRGGWDVVEGASGMRKDETFFDR